MNRPDWQTWLDRWLKRHPLREPPAHARGGYADQVMARIRAEAPQGRPAVFRLWEPRPSLAWGGALAAGLAVVMLVSAPQRNLRRLDRDSQILLAGGDFSFLEEDLEQELQEQETEDLVEEIEALDAVSPGEDLLPDEEIPV